MILGMGTLTDWLACLDLGMARGSRHDRGARGHGRLWHQPAGSQGQR